MDTGAEIDVAPEIDAGADVEVDSSVDLGVDLDLGLRERRLRRGSSSE
jgi:hypothetical protein